MASARSQNDIPLPRGWTKHVKSALINAVSLAATALNVAYGRTSTSNSARNRLRVELGRATTEIALLEEEYGYQGRPLEPTALAEAPLLHTRSAYADPSAEGRSRLAVPIYAMQYG